MKEKLIVANWKSHMTQEEAAVWIEKIEQQKTTLADKKIVICPPFTLLSFMQNQITEKGLPVFLGSQNISPFAPGAYTGEVNGQQIKTYAEYALIGHSERRRYFKEDDDILAKKVAMAREYGLEPIFCVENATIFIPQDVHIVAYEPLAAIGSGRPELPEDARKITESLQAKGIQTVLYGGSVTEENISDYTKEESIDGVLVGGASLDPSIFLSLITNA